MKGPTDIPEVQDYATRPTTGSQGVIYVDYTTGTLYTWNGTAYVSSVATSDEWNEIMHNGETFTVEDKENLSATITQNDVTNNPAALVIANTGSGNDITLPNSSSIKNGALTMGTSVAIAANTTISESSGDTLRENTSATNDIIDKLGDAAGATEHKTVDSADTTLHSIKSDGEIQAGKLDEAGVAEVKDAANTTTVKLNSVGDSYFNGGNTGFGTTTPSTTVSINGGLSRKMTDAGAADYNPSILTTDYKITANNTGAPRAIIISTEDIATGTATEPREFLASDYYGQAGANAITVSGESGTINGAASVVMSIAYTAFTIHADGTNLTIV